MRANINMMNCDCMEYISTCKDNHFDLAICDPPYGLKSTNFCTARSKKTGLHKDKKWNNFIPDEIYFNELMRVSKNQIIWGCNYYAKYIPHVGRIVHYKEMTSHNGPLKLSDCDLASCSIGNRIMYFHYQWSGNVQNGKINWKNTGTDARIHPTQKPVALYKWLLKNYAKEGDKILDTHGGSGSICIACWDMKFDLDWCELDKDYYDAAVSRFNEHKSQGQLF